MLLCALSVIIMVWLEWFGFYGDIFPFPIIPSLFTIGLASFLI